MNFSCHQKTRERLGKIVPEFKETGPFRFYDGTVSGIRYGGNRWEVLIVGTALRNSARRPSENVIEGTMVAARP
jgi:hypothetical protein